ncbi:MULTISPECIES: VOC family protein [Streptomyces]|uniref:Glyoxalase n=1 Tax=Streptomyces qinglanensis TaxID=943816 RepID=A0A1E7K6V9_9ACTN|nr:MULTISPECIES: glyoxalase/bleomycin resistance/dioxygenase family protein [Streptomyces]MBE9500263.1 glyoxalase/bleomycin resistance/dioxygenase family protein [Streptomyces sp. GKU 257-1]OEU99678.1 glyoxalase [Streptomyces qinglanensis]OEV27206.1 glyoxalase [Streptomyces nanshensis]
MDILGTSLRICVDDLDTAVPVYERLASAEAMRFRNGPVEVAAVGPFFLMSGPEEHLDVLSKVKATLAVKDVDDALADLHTVGAQIIAGPKATPIGRNLVARHPDGSVFEYVDRKQDSPAQ